MAQQQTTLQFPFPTGPDVYHPSPTLAELSRTSPVTEVTFADGKTAWLVTRYADVRQVLIDPRFSRAAATTPEAPQVGVSLLAEGSILGMDPPEHSRLRRLVARAFTAHRVEQLRPQVAGLVDELLDQVTAMPQPVDLVEHFALPLPVRVICELLGVPASDLHLFHAWSDAVMAGWDADREKVKAGLDQLAAYFATLIAAKRAQPADDLMSALIAARDNQDRLSEEELVTLSFGLLIAGHETTANQITMILLTLRQFPEELARLQAALDTTALDTTARDATGQDPTGQDPIPQAVEELMRFVQLGQDGVAMPRVTTEEVELGGVTIPAGAAVLPALGIANRDPAMFAEPNALDLSRDLPHHMSFGAGAHHCLGAQLARLELQEALRGLLRRMPGLRVAVPDDRLRFKPGMLVRSLESLPVTWDVPEHATGHATGRSETHAG